MAVADLVFQTLLDRGYHLEGCHHVCNLADSKLWYLSPSQARSFLAMTRASDYKQSVVIPELSLLSKYLPSLARHFSSQTTLNLVDFGCGDGYKAAFLVGTFPSRFRWHYLPLDVNAAFLRQAGRRLNQSNVKLVSFPPGDFLHLSPSQLSDKLSPCPSLFLLLGNTLGNFDDKHPLSFIHQVIRPGDCFIVGNGLVPPLSSADLLAAYSHPQIESWLFQLLALLGLHQQDLTYTVRFVNSRVEECFRFRRAVTLHHLNQALQFKPGDLLIIATSHKYTLASFRHCLATFFPRLQIFTNSNYHYALAFAFC